MSAELPSQFSHDVKIEETAQGIRIHVHAYANDQETAMVQAFRTYTESIIMADQLKILRAPMELKEVKKK